jgi:digeranylgeranylglycerophospholipid reductase
MQNYDVIIVGAGPAGCQCARELSQAGKQVLLIEKAKDFSVNNYSSGGAPLEIMEAFALPKDLVGTFWNKLALYTSCDHHLWTSPEPMGVVLNFMGLRKFLTEEALKSGATVMLDCAYQHHEKDDKYLRIHAKNNKYPMHTFHSQVLVDATGCDRKVLAQRQYDKSKALAATGIEYHVEVDKATYERYANTLSFYMGKKWMPQGYAWIFPIQPNQLKVGIIRYFARDRFVPYEDSFRVYLERMMQQCLGSSQLPILDKHGKTLYYTYRQKDRYFDANVIAIGDAISTLNPLASEGIRHAMISGKVAAKHIAKFLDFRSSFTSYPVDMRRYYGIKWMISEAIMKRIYREPDDKKIDLLLKTFKRFTFQELIDLAFAYKLSKALKLYAGYSWLTGLHHAKCFFRGSK